MEDTDDINDEVIDAIVNRAKNSGSKIPQRSEQLECSYVETLLLIKGVFPEVQVSPEKENGFKTAVIDWMLGPGNLEYLMSTHKVMTMELLYEIFLDQVIWNLDIGHFMRSYHTHSKLHKQLKNSQAKQSFGTQDTKSESSNDSKNPSRKQSVSSIQQLQEQIIEQDSAKIEEQPKLPKVLCFPKKFE